MSPRSRYEVLGFIGQISRIFRLEHANDFPWWVPFGDFHWSVATPFPTFAPSSYTRNNRVIPLLESPLNFHVHRSGPRAQKGSWGEEKAKGGRGGIEEQGGGLENEEAKIEGGRRKKGKETSSSGNAHAAKLNFPCATCSFPSQTELVLHERNSRMHVQTYARMERCKKEGERKSCRTYQTMIEQRAEHSLLFCTRASIVLFCCFIQNTVILSSLHCLLLFHRCLSVVHINFCEIK